MSENTTGSRRGVWVHTGHIFSARWTWIVALVGAAVMVWLVTDMLTAGADSAGGKSLIVLIAGAGLGFVVGWMIWPRRRLFGWRPLAPWRNDDA